MLVRILSCCTSALIMNYVKIYEFRSFQEAVRIFQKTLNALADDARHQSITLIPLQILWNVLSDIFINKDLIGHYFESKKQQYLFLQAYQKVEKHQHHAVLSWKVSTPLRVGWAIFWKIICPNLFLIQNICLKNWKIQHRLDLCSRNQWLHCRHLYTA